jgi:hypothetical protein
LTDSHFAPALRIGCEWGGSAQIYLSCQRFSIGM